jgi:hypothetical protein
MADLLPIGAFFTLHLSQGIGNAAPQVIASAIFFVVLAVQAFLHLHLLNKRYPERGEKNIWDALAVTFLAFVTFWLIVIALIVWAMNSEVQY